MRPCRIGPWICAIVALHCAAGCESDFYDIENLPASKLFRDKRVVELVTAAENGDVQTVETLVKAGVDVNARGARGVTPLMRCIFKQNKEGFRALLEHGADPNLLTKDGRSVLHKAAFEPDSFFMREALEHGGDANLPNTGNRFWPNSTPIFYAVLKHSADNDGHQGFHPGNARVLVAAGADVNYKNGEGRTPLLVATEAAGYEEMLILLEAGADFHSLRPFGRSLEEWLDPSSVSIEPRAPGYRKGRREYYLKVCDFLRAHGMQIRVPDEEAETLEKD